MAEWTQVFALAQRQYGLLERGQLASAGISVSAVNRRAAREDWQRLQPGVLALPGSVDCPERRILAAVLATGGDVAAARWTAAYLWGLTDRLRVPLTVVIPHGRRAARLDAVKVLRSRTLRQEDMVVRRGIAVTRPERMLGDLAAVTTRSELRDVAIDLRQRRMIDVPVLWELYERTWPVRGHEHLKRVLLDLGGDKVDSGLEWRTRGLCRRAGLPEPFPEPFPVEVEGRVVARVDIAWPAWKVGVECDGFRYHSERAQLEHDSARQNLLVANGWRLCRVTWRQVEHEPQTVVASIHRILQEAGAL